MRLLGQGRLLSHYSNIGPDQGPGFKLRPGREHSILVFLADTLFRLPSFSHLACPHAIGSGAPSASCRIYSPCGVVYAFVSHSTDPECLSRGARAFSSGLQGPDVVYNDCSTEHYTLMASAGRTGMGSTKGEPRAVGQQQINLIVGD